MPTTDELQTQINALRGRIILLESEIVAIKKKAIDIFGDMVTDRKTARMEEARLEVEAQARIQRLRRRMKG